MRLSKLLLAFSIALPVVSSCGSNSNSSTSPGTGSGTGTGTGTGSGLGDPAVRGASCVVSNDICIEIYAADIASGFKQECPNAGGTYFADKGCAVAGRKTGCEMTRNGTKTHTLWYYGQSVEAAKVGCSESAEEDPNFVPKVVAP